MIDHFERVGRKRLGDVLVDEALIAKEQLHEALGERQRSGVPLGQILVDSGYISEWDLAKAVATHYNLPFLDLSGFDINTDPLEHFPPELAHREKIVPFDRFGDVVCLACTEMPAMDVLRTIQEITSCVPCLYVGLGSDVARILREHVEAVDEVVELTPPAPGEVDVDDLFIDPTQKEGWEKIFDLANEEVLKESTEEA